MDVYAIEITDRVLAVVRNVLDNNAVVADVHPDSSLVDIGLDSMGMVALMLGVEAEFGITLEQPAITSENFASVRAMEAMIAGSIASSCGMGRRS